MPEVAQWQLPFLFNVPHNWNWTSGSTWLSYSGPLHWLWLSVSGFPKRSTYLRVWLTPQPCAAADVQSSNNGSNSCFGRSGSCCSPVPYGLDHTEVKWTLREVDFLTFTLNNLNSNPAYVQHFGKYASLLQELQNHSHVCVLNTKLQPRAG